MPTAAAGRLVAPSLALLLLEPHRARPGGLRHRRPRAQTPAGRDRADRVGELRLARRARGRRHGAHQQVRRGLPRRPLLRRLPVRGPGGDARHRARQEALQLPLRQRAVALGQHRQPGSLHGPDAAGRHVHGAQPRCRRPPHARLAGQPVGQMVQGRALSRAPAGPAHRLRRRGGARPPAQAEGDPGRRQRLSAHARLRRVPQRSPTRSAPT